MNFVLAYKKNEVKRKHISHDRDRSSSYERESRNKKVVNSQ